MKFDYLTLPKNLKNASKIDVIKRYLMDNFVIWDSVILKTNFEIKNLETVIDEKDSNELLWIKLWLKTIDISATNLHLNYAKYCATLISEKIDDNNKNDFLEDIFSIINNIYILTSFSLFYTSQIMFNFVTRNSLGKKANLVYKNRDKLIKILKENIPENYFSDTKIKNLHRKELFEYIKNIDYYYIIYDNILTLFINDIKVNTDCFMVVLNSLLKNNVSNKEKENISKALLNEINTFLN